MYKRQLYVSGEESENQLKLRAERLGVQSDALWLLCETSLDEILAAAERMHPGLLIVDSIQTLYTEDKTSSPGSIAQVRDCTMRLMQYSKRCGVTVFVVGHINKEGAIAGPKVLEHMVDCVLYFEGEEHTTYRLLRAAKNRFGSTNEIGVFEMDDRGLREVPNPSELLLAGRPLGTPGTCVACVMEGTRPVLAEVQALVCQTTYNIGSIISSQKVGPSIADDIKTSAVWSVLFALVAIGLYILLRFRNVAYRCTLWNVFCSPAEF